MKRLVIEGQHELTGKIKIGGAKNSVVALIPAAILASNEAVIYNVPKISDVDNLKKITEYLGSEISFINDTIKINNKAVQNKEITNEYSTKLRASYYYMGTLLTKYKHVEISFPGGCNIGSRPIDLHLKGFEKMGANIEQIDDKYIIDAPDLHGAEIFLDVASVGATLNIMFAAVKAKGITYIYNSAMEPEIVNVAAFISFFNTLSVQLPR